MRLIDADALIEFCAERWIPLNIDAVNMQPTIEPSTNCSEFPNNSDTISRQAAIDALTEHRALYCDNTPETFSKLSYVEKSRVDELDTAIATLVNLPPAQPEPQEGEWVQIQRCARDAQPDLECPFCKYRIGWFDMGRYCAGCGAKLKGGAG